MATRKTHEFLARILRRHGWTVIEPSKRTLIVPEGLHVRIVSDSRPDLGLDELTLMARSGVELGKPQERLRRFP